MSTSNTTNYGWVIPNDSELVKDGAAAIRTLGNSADASLKTVSDAAVQKSTVTTKGDLIAATAASTVSRVGVGTDGQVLTADSASSAGMKWAAVVAGATQNQVVFTSSQTWTVPSTAKYVDVMVVGGGSGGRGGCRNVNNSSVPGFGGAIVIMKDIYLNGTGTVSIVIGAGSSGTAGSSTTTAATSPGAAGYSAFGNYVYAGGASPLANSIGGLPGYKGTSSNNPLSFSNDSNFSNYAPTLAPAAAAGTWSQASGTAMSLVYFGANAIGLVGGHTGAYNVTSLNNMVCGAHPGMGDPASGSFSTSLTSNTIPQTLIGNLSGVVGAASAGTSGTSGGAGGAAGITGLGGGGGSCLAGAGQIGGQGGAGAGGGGSWPNPVGGNGGNGGAAGTNTGAGGGAGAHTGSTTGGTGGTGGNGAAGLVVVRWIS